MSLAVLEMSAALRWPTEPKTFCTSTRTNKQGHTVATCTFRPGHDHDHIDVHSGHTWK